MGIIVKQSVKGTVYSYVGATIGFVNTALLFPKFFSTGQVGLFFLLISVSMVFAQLFSLGFGGVTTRLFPFFIDKKNGHNGFPFLMVMTMLTGIIIFLITFYFVRPIIIRQNIHSPDFVRNVNLIIYITVIEIIFKMFNSYTSVLLNSAIGTFYKELILRILILIMILLFIFDVVDYHMFLHLYLVAQLVPAVALFYYVLKREEFDLRPNLKFISRQLARAIIFTALVSTVTGLTGIAYQTIDRYMINSMLNLSNTGIYTIGFFLGSMIGLPARNLKKIASVIIARAWKENDLKMIRDIYVKSSLTLSVIGSYLMLGVMINLNDIIAILGPDYEASRYVIFFVGLSFLIDLYFGVSYHVISNSRQYPYIAYMMLLFLLVVVVSNYFLIPLYGINGAAFASMASTLFYSILKYLFVWYKYKMQPFNIKHLIFLGISMLFFLAFYYLPAFVHNPYINIILKSTLFSLIFLPVAYFLKMSEDINEKMLYSLNVLKRFFIR